MTLSRAEEDLRQFLEDNCEPFRIPEGSKYQPYRTFEANEWSEHIEKTLSGGRVILVTPIEKYGHYRVKA
jgi:hypothetical protein